MKTVKQEEPIARSRFVDCPVCKNHSLKLKRTVQVGRCKSCNETYKVIIVFVKTPRTRRVVGPTAETSQETKQDAKRAASPEAPMPSSETPSESGLFGPMRPDYSGLSEAIFGETHRDQGSGAESSSGQ